ncbi:hypothetical protein [Nocardia farcinica]|uniref:Uncharacterized protein n=1 Tax=Nocardia farcinica (strain IFM 10152) TaxID=247156 RepID=Q5Z3V9_NOCFA|nr:hypothetical protein [Nocardia farcinica]BAD54882.1 hypothetical protein NFA_400 [Nocardia farcinica IFM 10152]
MDLVIALAAFVCGALLVAGWTWWREPRYVAHRRVVVNLRTGTAVEGVITRTRGRILVVRDATVHSDGGSASPADGEIVLDRGNVDYIQALGRR